MREYRTRARWKKWRDAWQMKGLLARFAVNALALASIGRRL
jgi:hypothetical protein